MTILEKIKFEEDWLSEVNLTKENIKIAFDGIRATVREQQQPCEDYIRVKKAWRLGLERGIYNATIHKGFTPVAWYTLSDSEIEEVEEKIKALEAQPCDDCISREEALKYSHIEYDDDGEGHRVIYAEDIEELSSVTPQPKVGKWIKTYEPNDAEPFILWECSKCQNAERGRRSKYCPYCGIKMEVQ